MESTNGWHIFKRYYSSQAELLPVLEYMECRWIWSEIANLYKVFMPGYLSTNNRLDTVNKTLKDNYTLHVKLGMAELKKWKKT